MKTTKSLRVFALILTLVMTLSLFVACDKGNDAETQPVQTTKAPETTKGSGNGDETPAPSEHTHSFGEATVTKAATCTAKGEKTATCSCGEKQVTDIPMLTHHTYADHKCACGAEEKFANAKYTYKDLSTVEKASVYDGNNDGTKDTFYFAKTLAGEFKAINAIHINAKDYDTTLTTTPPSKTNSSDIDHYYIKEDQSPAQFIVYKVTVPEAGYYDMAIHMRLKDDKERGSKYTINDEYTFETSFKPTNTAEIESMKGENESSYMYGIQIKLKAGENTIKIEQSSKSPKNQHYRDIYLVNHDHKHTFTNYKCACGAYENFSNKQLSYTGATTVSNASAYDGNKDGTKDTFYFAPTLADEFKGANVVHVSGTSHVNATDANQPSQQTVGGITHVYITENSDPAQAIVYKVTVTEAGVYDMAIHMRLKDNKQRGSKYTINGDYTFETSFEFAVTTDYDAAVLDQNTYTSYMYGMQIYLEAGENTITIEQSSNSPKCQHYRDLYFVKVA